MKRLRAGTHSAAATFLLLSSVGTVAHAADSKPASPPDLAAELKSGLLLRHGFAAGTAALAQFPIKDHGKGVQAVALDAMPYLVLAGIRNCGYSVKFTGENRA